MPVDLSVVLPKFNGNSLARESVRRLDAYLAGFSWTYEIIVVDDGSVPGERMPADGQPGPVRVLYLEKNRGKGYAVRKGMLEAKGRVRVFTDIDLPYDLSAIRYAFDIMDRSSDIHYVAGDRTLFYSHYFADMPLSRRISSKIFSKLVTLLVIGGIYDSQCGLKVFSARLAEALFPLLTIDRFSFDVEIYYLLLKYNVMIRRIPICLRAHEVSTVNLFKHALPMAARIMRIPFNWYSGRYRSEAMLEFCDKPYWGDVPCAKKG